MALIHDFPVRFGLISHAGYALPHQEYRMAVALKEAADAIQDSLYYEHAGLDLLENDAETRELLDKAYLALRPVVYRYFGESLFYEPSIPEPAAETKPEPEPEEPKKRTIGIPFKRIK